MAVPALMRGAATITIINADGAGVGFNDPTPVAPVGGNPGITLGQQRLNAFQAAANIWGAVLTSAVTIQVSASWPALTCNATSAVLGAAGPTTVHANFTGAIVPGVWYHQALANKLSGADRSAAQPDIVAQFNRNLGNAGCLTGRFFYLGLDGNAPANTVHFLAVLLHELGHGLGFSTTTSGSTGAVFSGRNSVFDAFLLDKSTNTTWLAGSNFIRQQSAINGVGNLVWTGPNSVAAVPNVLSPAAQVSVTAPASSVATYTGAPSTLGPTLTSSPVSGELMPVTSVAGGGNACAPLTGADASAVNNRIAVIDRGGCTFAAKALNAQNAGAKGVIFINTVADRPPVNITDPTPGVTIPNGMISQQDGALLRNALRFRSRAGSGVFATLGPSSQRAGADSSNWPIMYAPSVFSSGSSVSHWDISPHRNLLMEPFINADLTLSVVPPQDMTFSLLQDLGW
jgi:hypothetical protein